LATSIIKKLPFRILLAIAGHLNDSDLSELMKFLKDPPRKNAFETIFPYFLSVSLKSRQYVRRGTAFLPIKDLYRGSWTHPNFIPRKISLENTFGVSLTNESYPEITGKVKANPGTIYAFQEDQKGFDCVVGFQTKEGTVVSVGHNQKRFYPLKDRGDDMGDSIINSMILFKKAKENNPIFVLVTTGKAESIKRSMSQGEERIFMQAAQTNTSKPIQVGEMQKCLIIISAEEFDQFFGPFANSLKFSFEFLRINYASLGQLQTFFGPSAGKKIKSELEKRPLENVNEFLKRFPKLAAKYKAVESKLMV